MNKQENPEFHKNSNKENATRIEKIVGVAAIFISEDGDVCLFQRDDKGDLKNKWQIIAGGVDEQDESLLESLQREVTEETMLKLEEIRALQVIPIGLLDRSHLGILPKLQCIVRVPLDKKELFKWNSTPNPETNQTEGQTVAWVSLDRVNQLDLTPGTKQTFSSPGALDALLSYAKGVSIPEPVVFGYNALPEGFSMSHRGTPFFRLK